MIIIQGSDTQQSHMSRYHPEQMSIFSQLGLFFELSACIVPYFGISHYPIIFNSIFVKWLLSCTCMPQFPYIRLPHVRLRYIFPSMAFSGIANLYYSQRVLNPLSLLLFASWSFIQFFPSLLQFVSCSVQLIFFTFFRVHFSRGPCFCTIQPAFPLEWKKRTYLRPGLEFWT